MRKISFDVLNQEGVSLKDSGKGTGLAFPRLVKEAKPTYPKNLRENKVEGAVHYKAVVLADGSVGGIWLTKLLHAELEQAGLDAVRRWRFDPAVLNGNPVPAIIDVEMSFTLK